MAIHINTAIATLYGYVKASNLQIGDLIIGSNGRTTRVTNIDTLQDMMYKVTYADGSSVKVNSGHMWSTNSATLINTVSLVNNTDMIEVVQGVGVICNPTAALPYTPAVMGKVLTHGHLVSAKLDSVYLYSSEPQRHALFIALVGSNIRKSDFIFHTASEHLAKQVTQLSRSLGVFAWYSHISTANYVVYGKPTKLNRVISIESMGTGAFIKPTVDAVDGHYAVYPYLMLKEDII